MAFPSIRSQVASAGESANTTSHTISYPATITAGDTLLCFVACDGDNTFDWAAAETSRGWVKLYEVSSSDSQTCLSVGWIKASGSESGTFELSSSQNEESAARMFAIQDAADPTVTAPDVSASNQSAGSTTVTFNIVTPAGGSKDYLWFIGIGYDDDDGGMTTNFPTNYDTNKAYDISGTGAGTGSLDTSNRTNAATSESPGNGTAVSNEEWVSAVVGVHPAAAADDHTLLINEALHAQAADGTTVFPDVSAIDALHAHTADPAELDGEVTPADAAHAHAADPAELDGEVTPADADHAHAADLAELDGEVSPADADHAHTADAATLGVNVTIAEALHGHAAGAATLGVNVTIAETLHAHAVDNVTVTDDGAGGDDHTLVIQEATHAQTADAATLGVNVTIEDATHAQAADNAGLGVNVTIAETLHDHAADNVTVTDDGAGGDDHTLLVQEAIHAQAAAVAGLGVNVTIAGALHDHAVDGTTLFPDVSALDALHGHAADVAGLGVNVTIDEALHAHLADPALIHFIAPGNRTLVPGQPSGNMPAGVADLVPDAVT